MVRVALVADLPRGLPEALGGEGIASCRLSYSLLRGDATVTRTAPVRRQEPGFRASLDENAPKPVGDGTAQSDAA